MKKALYCIILLLILALAGCEKKKYPEPVEATETPFFTKLFVNGQPLEITTGKNGYYMYSSFAMDSSGVYNLLGEFKQAGCSNCTNSVRFQINDSKAAGSPNASINIDSALQVGSYDFLSGNNDLAYSVTFSGAYNKAGSTLLWDFGDGTTSTEMYPTHIFKTGTYHVVLTVTAPDMGQSIIVNTLSLKSAADLNVYVTAAPVMGALNAVAFTPHITGGKAPYTYTWQFGDGTGSAAPAASHAYAVKGGYGVKLKVTDAEGKSVTCSYNAVAGNDPSALTANFGFSDLKSTGKRLALSKASIRYTDASGTTFSSDNALQPQGSSLEIVSVEDFVKNENNQSVKKIKLKFNCTLYNGTQSVSFQGSEVLVGFAYK